MAKSRQHAWNPVQDFANHACLEALPGQAEAHTVLEVLQHLSHFF